MSRASLVLAVLLAAGLLACSGVKRIPQCGLGDARAIGFDDALPDGRTARAFADQLPGSHRGSLKWFNSPLPDVAITSPAPLATTSVYIDLSGPAISPRYRPGITPPDLQGTACPGAVEVTIGLWVVTADGGLDEQWIATATQATGGGALLTVDLEQQPLAGSLRVVPANPEAWDDTTFAFQTSLQVDGTGSGSVYYTMSRETNGLHEGASISAALFSFTAADGGAP